MPQDGKSPAHRSPNLRLRIRTVYPRAVWRQPQANAYSRGGGLMRSVSGPGRRCGRLRSGCGDVRRRRSCGSVGRLLDRRFGGPAGRVVPGEERAGHVSRPRPSRREPAPDLDTPPRSSSATRSAVAWFRWSSSARRGTSRARVETSTKSSGTRAGSRQASSFLVGYSISGCVGSRWSSSARRGTSRARVETSAKSPGRVAGFRHASSFLVGYSISGWGVPLVE